MLKLKEIQAQIKKQRIQLMRGAKKPNAAGATSTKADSE